MSAFVLRLSFFSTLLLFCLATIAVGNHAVIDSMLPEQNAIDVPVTNNISVKFKLSMDPETINESTFLVLGSHSGRHMGQVENRVGFSKRTYFYSENSFIPGEIVTVKLTDDIRTMDGAYLTNGFSWSFTAEAFRGKAAFTLKPPYSAGNSPTSVAAADLDDNGYNDLIITNSESDDITIHMGTIMGMYGPPATYSVGNNAMQTVVVDIDNDDDLDLVVVSYQGQGIVSTMINNGDGTFTFGGDYSVGSANPHSVCAADFDGDGDIDLATANFHGDDISILINDGTGVFLFAANYAAGSAPWSICSADLDNDGDADLAAIDYISHNVFLYLNNGDGAFSPAGSHSSGPMSSPRTVIAADFNGDGNIDLATANRDNNGVGVMLNLGSATFATTVVYPAGAWTSGLCSGDFDADGDIDLMTGNYNSNDLSLLLNNGDGAFSHHATYPVGDRPQSVCAADLDNDGDMDAVCANRGANNIMVLMNDDSPATWFVSYMGNDVSGDGSPASPFATIQHAIDMAASLDTVIVMNGVYIGNGNRDIDFLGKLIFLKSQNGPEVTVIDCQATEGDFHQGILLMHGEEKAAVIEGLTIQNAFYSGVGAGIYCAWGTSPTIRGCILRNNTSQNTGAGIGSLKYSSPRIFSCTFENNHSNNHGGAIDCHHGEAIIANCDFAGNTVDNVGGAIACGEEAAPLIGGCNFVNNSADGGAAIGCAEGSRPNITDCYFEDNLGNVTGVISANRSIVNLENCTFRENSAGNNSAAIVLSASTATISSCVFDSNMSDYGGAVNIIDDSASVFSECIFKNNTANNNGGAIVLWRSITQFINCTFIGNSSPNGSGVWMSKSSPGFENCIMAFGRQSPSVACQNENSPAFTCCDLYGNTGGDWVGCISGMGGINNNFSYDPFFCDTANGDYHLQPFSPCTPANSTCGALVGALDVGCLLEPMFMEPDPMYSIYMYAMETMVGTIYLGDFPGVYTALSVDQVSVRVNESIVPLNVEIVASPMFMDQALAVSFSIADCLHGYGSHWGAHSHRYSVSGLYLSGVRFVYTGSVACFGHIPGDLNFDEAVNIADVVYMVNYVFLHGPAPAPIEIADINHDSDINIGDAVFLINHIISGASPQGE